MTSGMLPEEKRNLERQMGCMAGFFQLFDRHQILAGKRIYSTRRLPSSPVSFFFARKINVMYVALL